MVVRCGFGIRVACEGFDFDVGVNVKNGAEREIVNVVLIQSKCKA